MAAAGTGIAVRLARSMAALTRDGFSAPSASTATMIDHEARRAIRSAVDDFLDGTITAFGLDERLTAIDTKDDTADRVIRLLWYTYDDLTDHGPEMWDKAVWDWTQRLLLLLDSGAELVVSPGRWIWRWSQLVAVLGLVLVAALHAAVFHQWLFPVLIGGGVSMAIMWWRERREPRSPAWADAAAPFGSPAEIQGILRQLPTWRKRRHPGGKALRLRPRCCAWVFHAYARFLWCLISPLALAVQALPGRQSTTTVVAPTGNGCMG